MTCSGTTKRDLLVISVSKGKFIVNKLAFNDEEDNFEGCHPSMSVSASKFSGCQPNSTYIIREGMNLISST